MMNDHDIRVVDRGGHAAGPQSRPDASYLDSFLLFFDHPAGALSSVLACC